MKKKKSRVEIKRQKKSGQVIINKYFGDNWDDFILKGEKKIFELREVKNGR